MSESMGHLGADELIPNRNEIRWGAVPPLLWASAALLIAFAALGVYSQSVHEMTRRFALLSRWESGMLSYAYAGLVGGSFQVIMGTVPAISALVMLWISFVNPRCSDRMLWSSAMIFTAYELAADATYLFPHNTGGEVYRSYPRVAAVVGLIAYGSWLLIIPESTMPTWMKRVLGAICVLAILVILAYPLIDAYTRTVDTVGAVLFAGALSTLGVFVAGRVGVNLFGRGGAETGK
jgi:hypothetical protein